MSTTRRTSSVVATCGALFGALALVAAPAEALSKEAGPRDEGARYCVVVLDRLRPGETASHVLDHECSADANALDSKYRVQGGTPLITWYADGNYNGDSTTIYGQFGTCDSSGYGIEDVGWFWNDRISSYRVHGLCHRNHVFENANYGGAGKWFYGDVSYTGGYWNDKISSMWLYSKY